VKRSILGLLAAAFLASGVISAPSAWAQTRPSALAAIQSLEHHHDRGDGHDRYWRGRDEHHRSWRGDDHDRYWDRDDEGDEDGGHHGRRRCSGLVVVCL